MNFKRVNEERLWPLVVSGFAVHAHAVDFLCVGF